MLKSEDIIGGLQSIVNNYSVFAIIWHIFFYALIGALFLKWEPSARILGILLVLPVLSVAILAWKTGNPFNGSVFAAAAILLTIFIFRISGQTLSYSGIPFMTAGILMVIFGLVYPHFISPDSVYKYLYSAPTGLIPCPTLSVLIGFLLIYNGLGSNSITLTLIALGLFYGIFGFLKLAVRLDIFLVIGTIALLIRYIISVRTPAA